MLEDDTVSFWNKVYISMRTEWTLGACFFAYDGDPFLRSHRLLVVWAVLLVAVSAALLCVYGLEKSSRLPLQDF